MDLRAEEFSNDSLDFFLGSADIGAFTTGETVGFDHALPVPLHGTSPDVFLAIVDIEVSGGDAVTHHEQLGVDLTVFELRGRLVRTNDQFLRVLEGIGHTVDSRQFRSYDSEVDVEHRRDAEQAVWIVELDRGLDRLPEFIGPAVAPRTPDSNHATPARQQLRPHMAACAAVAS